MQSIQKTKATEQMSMPVRTRILAVASDLFERQGFVNTGINQIIEDSGSAKASFYDHFLSKEKLGQEYLKIYGDGHIGLIRTLMERSDSVDVFVEGWVRILKRQLRNKNFYGCPMANLRAQTTNGFDLLQSSIADLANKTIEVLADCVEKFDRSQITINREKALLTARRIFAAYEGAVHVWQLTGDASALDDIAFLVRRLLPPAA
jgi:AcrR family transcriptional regulator